MEYWSNVKSNRCELRVSRCVIKLNSKHATRNKYLSLILIDRDFNTPALQYSITPTSYEIKPIFSKLLVTL